MVERGRTQVKIWRMRIAWWKPYATETHSEYVTYFLFYWLHERASVLGYKYSDCLVDV